MSEFTDYKIADLSLADFGRKEIAIAETEMPGLMALRTEYGDSQPLKGWPQPPPSKGVADWSPPCGGLYIYISVKNEPQ